MNNHKLLRMGGATVALFFALSAHAQDDADNYVIDEVLVTAEKRDSSLQDTPLSVSVLSGDELDAIGISTVEELQFFVPGVTITNDAMAIVNIRGIGTSAFGVGADPSSTVHIDGVYIPRPTTGYQDMFDIERVELLRGPQGVLFGRNSSGGTLNIISKSASEELEGAIEVAVGNLNKRKISGTLSGALSDRTRARATLLYNERDGRYSDPVFGREYQDQNTIAGRFALEFDASDNLDVVLRADFNNEDEAGYPTVQNVITADLLGAGATLTNGKDELALDGNPIQKIDTLGASATLTWDLGEMSFKSTSAFRSSDVEILIDVDSTDLFLRNVGVQEYSDSFSQEFLLSSTGDERLRWTAGLFYFTEDGDDNLDLFFGPTTIVIPGTNKTDAWALFGQASYDFNDRLTGTFGLRYSSEEKDYGTTTFVNGTNVGSATPSDDWDDFTPRFSLDYAVNEDVMLYASASRGFKSGGFQVGESNSFDPEYLWSYEAGVKSVVMDQRLRANFGVFFYDFTDLQVITFVNGIGQTDNAGKATLQGFEAEFLARPSDGLDLSLNIAYLDATYDRFTQAIGGVEVDLAGNTLPNTPEWTFSAGAQYSHPVSNAANLTFRGDFGWRDEVNFKSDNAPRFQTDSYGLLNVRIGYENLDQGWQLSLYGTNLTDEDFATYKTDGQDATGSSSANNPLTVFGEPRQYGVSFRYDF